MGIHNINLLKGTLENLDHLNHEHVWGPWLIMPKSPTHIVRRCECGAEDEQEVE